jgi:hypothetical protein
VISSIQFLLSLRLALSRAAPSPGWVDITQGDDVIQFGLRNLDLSVWDDAYIATLLIEGGTDETVDLKNFTSMVYETVNFTKVHGIVVMTELVDPALTDAEVIVRPGAANGVTWMFLGGTSGGVSVPPGGIFAHFCPEDDTTGYPLDATRKTVEFDNPGADDINAYVAVVGAT